MIHIQKLQFDGQPAALFIYELDMIAEQITYRVINEDPEDSFDTGKLSEKFELDQTGIRFGELSLPFETLDTIATQRIG